MAQKEEHIGSNLRDEAMQLTLAVVFPMVLRSAIELDIIDKLYAAGRDGRGFLSPSEITSTIHSVKNPEATVVLDRMLRLLASNSILECSFRTKENGEIERVYAAGPICKFLAKSQEGENLAPLFLLHHDKVFMKSWDHLNDAILEGGVPFDKAYGMSAFDYLGNDQRFNNVFNQALSSHTTLVMKAVLETYQGFQGVNVLVDVGGGIGAALSIITSKYPHIKGINYDLPHVVANAPTYAGVEHVEGDMFESVPKGDAIFMKGILHDWSDDHCLKLLKNCFEALPNGGKVIIVELILPEASCSNKFTCGLDVFMLTQHHGGKERSKKEYQDLALKSGFSSCEIITCGANYWVIEFHKRVDS